jgi:hypothetical protein
MELSLVGRYGCTILILPILRMIPIQIQSLILSLILLQILSIQCFSESSPAPILRGPTPRLDIPQHDFITAA